MIQAVGFGKKFAFLTACQKESAVMEIILHSFLIFLCLFVFISGYFIGMSCKFSKFTLECYA